MTSPIKTFGTRLLVVFASEAIQTTFRCVAIVLQKVYFYFNQTVMSLGQAF